MRIKTIRITKVEFLVLTFFLQLISCQTTSEYNPLLNNFKSQFKSYVDQNLYHNPPHEHFAMAVGGEYCKGVIRSNFTKNDAMNEAIDLCNSYNECNDCRVILYEDFSDFNVKAEIANSKSKRKTLLNQNVKPITYTNADYNADAQEDYYNRIMSEENTKSTQFIDLDSAKTECEDLGFKNGTEKFGECVLKLSE